MTRRSKRCAATTKKGARCKNSAKAEFGGFCVIHRKIEPTLRPNVGSLSTTDKVGLAANSIAIAGAVIKVVTFVATHWDAIRDALSTMGMAFLTFEEWSTEGEISDEEAGFLAEEAKRLWSRSHAILTGNTVAAFSTAESSRFRHDFAAWFNALPDDVRARTRLHLDEATLDQLLT